MCQCAVPLILSRLDGAVILPLRKDVMVGGSAYALLLSVRGSLIRFHYEARSTVKTKKLRAERPEKPERRSYRVRLPGFITEQDIGLGDVIKRATSAAGIKPCASCERRAAMLNRWMVFGKR